MSPAIDRRIVVRLIRGPRGITVGAALLVAAVALVMLVAGIVVVAEGFFVGDRSPAVTTAGSSLALAGATVGLLLGSFLAAWYLRLQVREARRLSEAALLEAEQSRETLLRPVPVFADVRGGSLNVGIGDDDEYSLTIRNVGPGPALNMQALGWDRHDDDGTPLDPQGENLEDSAPTHQSGPDVLGPGDSIEVLLWPTSRRRTERPRPSGPLHLRIICLDVFGNAFSTPATDEPALRVRFVRRPS